MPMSASCGRVRRGFIMLKMTKAVASMAVLASLGACGGGGGSDSSPSTPAPVASPTPAPTGPTVIAANLVTSVPAFTGSDTDRTAAYTKLNAIRGTCGFGLLAQNAQLETAAAHHANYIEGNFVAHPEVFGHVENAAYPGFTGAQPHDRNLAASYGDSSQSEDLVGVAAGSTTPQADGVGALLQAGYHTKYLVGQGAYDMGVAAKVVPLGGVTVIELGSKVSLLQDISSTDVSTYPCAGITVKTSPLGIGRETPDPLPARDYSSRPVGQPIYVRVRVGQTLAISSFTVVSATGTNIAQAALLSQANDPNKILSSNEVLFYPDTPLAAGAQYTVTINGTNNGVTFTRTVAFNTI